MNFEWTEDQLQMQRSIIEFAGRDLRDDVLERDKKGIFSRPFWDRCASFGIQGLPFPGEFGGQEADILTTVAAMEGLGYACRDNGLVFGINAQMWSVQMPIFSFASGRVRKKYLPDLCSGAIIGAHGMSEPGSGSDAFSLSTTATRDGTSYVLNGSKTFVSLAPVADIFVVFATVNRRQGFMGVTAFLVPGDTPGFRVGKEISKMGLRTCPWAELFLEDCHVPAENRLGREGSGAAIFSDSMEWERGCLLAGFVGAMKRQLEACISYVKGRRQFGRPIGKFQAVSHKIADMRIRLEASRLLLYRLAWEKAKGGRSPLSAAMVKLYISESWKRSSQDAIQIHGGYGYTTEYEVERDLRDAVASSLYSGTSEIQKNIMADSLGI